MTREPKTVLITGATRGIGRACAAAFAAGGHRLALHAGSRLDLAEELAATLPGGPHVALRADLGDGDATARLAQEAWAALGRVDVLVNNAGIYAEHPPLETDDAAWDAAWARTIAVNLTGPARLCHRLGRRMAAAGGGRIVNVSSRGAFRGEPTAPAYGASKAGLNAMGQSLAKALAPAGVLVYTLAPGWVETDMAAGHLSAPAGGDIRAQSPLNRVASPAEMADCVLWLATAAPAFATGAILDANGASHLRS